MESLYHVGVDLHKKTLQVAVVNEEGQEVDNRRIPCIDRDFMKEFFGVFPAGTPVTIEATSGWEWINDFLEELKLKVKLANPHKVKLIAESTIKTDKIDAATLAQLERTDFLPQSYRAPKDIRQQRELLRYRFSLVKIRTFLKNRIHSILGRRGIIYGRSDLFGRAGKEFLREMDMPEIYKKEIGSYLDLMDTLDTYIDEMDKEIKKIVKEENSQAKLLTTIPGISYLSGLLIVSEIGDIERFLSAKKLRSYAGLAPTTSQSGGKVYQGHLKKDSNRYIKWILIEAVPHVVKKDPALGEKYCRVSRRKGTSKAKIAVAQKICTSIYKMLKNKQPYIMEKKRKRFYLGKPLTIHGHK